MEAKGMREFTTLGMKYCCTTATLTFNPAHQEQIHK
jgi:hypothetical protein